MAGEQPVDAPDEAASQGPVATWRYVVPNAVTSASLVIGLMSMVAAVEGRFEAAGWLIVLCVLLDKLDGTFARLLGATSKFGTQLDSLADLVVFGVTPAGVVLLLARAEADVFAPWSSWQWAMYACLALFVVASSLRLAKFNVLSDSDGPAIFYGMPTTLGGGTIGLLILVGLEHDLEGLLRTLPLVCLVFGLMMVSNLPLPKIGKRESKAANIFLGVNLALSYVCGFARIYPEYLLAVTLTFAVSGFVWGQLHRDELSSGDDERDDELTPQPG